MDLQRVQVLAQDMRPLISCCRRAVVSCMGDCKHDGEVTIDEIITGQLRAVTASWCGVNSRFIRPEPLPRRTEPVSPHVCKTLDLVRLTRHRLLRWQKAH